MAEPLVLVSGDGARVTDDHGNQYLDARAALWYTLIGHGRSEMADAIARHVRTLEACSCFDVMASDTTLELAETLAGMVPVSNPSIFLTSGGSASVDTAAKIVRRYWSELGRPESESSCTGTGRITERMGTARAWQGSNQIETGSVRS